MEPETRIAEFSPENGDVCRFSLSSRLSPDAGFTGEGQKGAEKDRYNLNDPPDFWRFAFQAAEGMPPASFGSSQANEAARIAATVQEMRAAEKAYRENMGAPAITVK